MRRSPGAGQRWWLAAALACGCRDEPTAAEPPPASTAIDPARAGKVDPAPASEVAFGRAVLEALQRDDWEGYTNLLATRADMMGLFRDEERDEGRERRKRRRMVWRRVNRLRQSEAEGGWKSTRADAARDGVAWDAVRLVDIRREPVREGVLPAGVEASTLELVLEHGGVERVLSLGLCARAQRGWIATDPIGWQRLRPTEPRGESLLGREP